VIVNILKTVLLVNLALLSNLSHALVMPAVGSSLIVDQRETLYVNDGDVFDLSSLSITSSGGIDIYGNTQNAAFSMVANSFINIGGYLNLYVYSTTFKANEINLSGIINVVGGGQLSLFAENSLDFNGTIFFDGVPPTPPSDGTLTGIRLPIEIQPPKIILSAIPEPESYALLLAGLCVVGLAMRRAPV
jgi:hypothetical protein